MPATTVAARAATEKNIYVPEIAELVRVEKMSALETLFEVQASRWTGPGAPAGAVRAGLPHGHRGSPHFHLLLPACKRHLRAGGARRGEPHLRAARAEGGRQDRDPRAVWKRIRCRGAPGKRRDLRGARGWGFRRFAPSSTPCSIPAGAKTSAGSSFSTESSSPSEFTFNEERKSWERRKDLEYHVTVDRATPGLERSPGGDHHAHPRT